MFRSFARHSLAPICAASMFAVSLLPACSDAAAAAVTPTTSPSIATATQINRALLATRVCLDAEALAAAGVNSNAVGTVMSALHNTATALGTPLSELDAACVTARTARNAVERKIQSGSATQQEIESLAGLEQALTTTESARDSALNSIFNSAIAGLSSEQRTTLATLRANRGWKVSTEFLVVSRAEEQWIALRDALSNERVAAKNGDTPNTACQTLLAIERANASVAAAKASLDTNLASLQQAWNSATSG